MQEADARFGQFYGYERPLYFASKTPPTLSFGKPEWFDKVASEVDPAHTKAAIFDQSTFGKILVEGTDAETFLNRVCANNLTRVPGRVIYTTVLNERAGIESDLTALRISEESYRLYVGTSAIKRDMAWLKRHVKDNERVTLNDETEDYAIIGLMGPDAAQIANYIAALELNEIKYFRHREIIIGGILTRAVRLSYVGEAGWEIVCCAKHAVVLYDKLYNAGARPAGLYAQTSMRIEKRFLSYGHDLDTDITPLEAGLDFAVDWEKEFVGRDALLRRRDTGIHSKITTLVLYDGDAVPLGNEPIYHNDKIVGKTSSAAFGYRIGKPLALGYIAVNNTDNTLESKTVQIDIAGTLYDATVSYRAVFDPTGQRMKQGRL